MVNPGNHESDSKNSELVSDEYHVAKPVYNNILS